MSLLNIPSNPAPPVVLLPKVYTSSICVWYKVISLFGLLVCLLKEMSGYVTKIWPRAFSCTFVYLPKYFFAPPSHSSSKWHEQIWNFLFLGGSRRKNKEVNAKTGSTNTSSLVNTSCLAWMAGWLACHLAFCLGWDRRRTGWRGSSGRGVVCKYVLDFTL